MTSPTSLEDWSLVTRQHRSLFSSARGSLAKQWEFEERKCKYFPAVQPQPNAHGDEYQLPWKMFFDKRPYITDRLSIPEIDPDKQTVLIYEVLGHDDDQDTSEWTTGWHGTRIQALPGILANGYLASEDRDLGHRVLQDGQLTGIYNTPIKGTGWGYAVPCKIFDDLRFVF